MTWNVEWDERARRELRRLDNPVQQAILRYFSERIQTDEDPRRFGRGLGHSLRGLWRYRIGDYRAICRIEDERLTVFVLGVAHRREVYR